MPILNRVNNYNWDNIDFPAGHKDYSAFEKNNSDIAINILYVPYKTKQIRQAYISNTIKPVKFMQIY